MTISIVDIANKVGVSDSAVSRVLRANGKKIDISLKRQQQILQAAKEMGYRPHAGAQSLRSNRFNTIGLATVFQVPGQLTTYRIDSSSTIMTELGQHGMGLLLLDIGSIDPHQQQIPHGLMNRAFDGLIVAATPSEAIEQHIRQINMPAIYLNVGQVQPYNCIVPDDFEIGYLLTKLLLELGHRRIAVIGTWEFGLAYQTQRMQGHRCAMAEAGLCQNQVSELRSNDKQWCEYIDQQLFGGDSSPTAAIGLTCDSAMFVRGQLMRRGLLPGKDMALLSMDLFEWMGHYPRISGMRLDHNQMGIDAAQLMLQILANPKQKQCSPNQLIKAQWALHETLCTPQGHRVTALPKAFKNLRLEANDFRRSQFV